MVEIILKSNLHMFSTCKEFVREFEIGADDLILSNEYIYKPCFEQLDLKCYVLFQEKYGLGEPSDVMAEALLADIAAVKCKRIIAIGGGTIIDLAKVIAVADTTNVDNLYNRMPNLSKVMELVIVPTTCGTGSEVTNIAVLNRVHMGTKMGMVAPAMYADHAVLIPELLTGLPFQVFATSSIDAMVHAVESCLSPKATPYSKLFGYKAIEMIVCGYQKIVRDGPEARLPLMEEFLIASNYAGIAFGTTGVGIVHAMAYPLGGTYHIAHGESNYAIFTGALKNYMEIKTGGEIAAMNQFLANLLDCDVNSVYESLDRLLNQILPKKALREYGVTEQDLNDFTDSVMTTQGRLMANNFVPMDEKRVYKIYSELY